MKMLKISNNEISELANATQYEFPKYATQMINLVNSNAGGTRPKVVGQMSELIKEFDGRSIDEWIEWYTERVIQMLLMMLQKRFGVCTKQ